MPTLDLLDQLSAQRLRALTEALGLEVTDRRSKSGLTAALLTAPFLNVAGAMTLPELKLVCTRLGIKPKRGTKGTKATLVGLIASAADRPTSTLTAAETVGGLKGALRRLAIDSATFRGRDASQKLVTALLACFGWPDGRPPGAQLPASLTLVEHGGQTTRKVAALWPERRTLIDVLEPDASLEEAWKDLLRACLQVEPQPQYVLLTNLRDLHLYDLGHARDAPRLRLSIDDLAKHSEALPFLSSTWVPGSTPKIVNVGKVSGEVADLVARLFRSLKEQHPEREQDVIAFTLQCIVTMFAEDIGLLPREHFTALLYEGARHGDVEARLAKLFHLMSTRDVPAPRPVAFFNGGLFKQPVTVPLGDAQLSALTRAAEANWKYVDPHIFGSVFQGIMGAEERHATGAHYTAHDDIMRVVGPTIVEPWRKRIGEASTLQKLLELRDELFRFRVLDPACGSGNFLYIAFRELYRLDTELLGRIRQFPSASGIKWSLGLPTSNFYGFDTNRFAVELAKVTLNIAKKIAFEERRESMAAFGALSLAFDIDPSLPLDNLDKNIVCADALFTDWPSVDAIVGNPPFLGGLKIRNELGAEYLGELQQRFPNVNGRADYCSFWFRLAHDHIEPGGRVGLVATNTVREGNTREAATEYIVNNGGTITNAVSSQQWPGMAVVNVSMINWVKGPAEGEPRRLTIDGVLYEPKQISPSLQLEADLGGAQPIAANARGTTPGVQLGTKGFQFDTAVARGLLTDERARTFVKPVAVASHWLNGRLANEPEYVIDMSRCESEADAKRGGAAFDYLKREVYHFVKEKADSATVSHYSNWLRSWWRPIWPRLEFMASAEALPRILICSRHAARPIFGFISREFLPTESIQLFAFADDYTFGVLQSTCHWTWAVGVGSKIKEDTRYTSEVWTTFPWPQAPSEEVVAAVAAAGRALRATREILMAENNWSLRALHQAADVKGPHPLKDAQRLLDAAVANAYGISEGQDLTEFLLELNRCLVEDEQQGRAVDGPGLPRGFEASDPRWSSNDCIRSPPLNEEASRAANRR